MDILGKSLCILVNEWWIYLIFGSLIGSFLNVVIGRVPKGESVIYPASHCPTCNKNIKWYDNIPVFSFIFLKAKCRNCKTKISWQYPLVEFTVAICSLFIFLHFQQFSLLLIFSLLLFYILFAIALIDFQTYSIPQKLIIFLFLLGVTFVFLNLYFEFVKYSFLDSLWGLLSGYLFLYVIQVIGRMVYKQEAMGGGDLLLLACGGIFIGWKGVLLAFFIGSLIAVIFYAVPAIIVLFKKKDLIYEFYNKYQDCNNSKTENIYFKILDMITLFHLKDNKFEYQKAKILDYYKDNEDINIQDNLLLFFAMAMIEDEVNKMKFLKALEQQTFTKIDLKHILEMDLIGFWDRKLNLCYLEKELLKDGYHGDLNNILTELKHDYESEKNYIPKISEVFKKYDSLNDVEEKLTYLLDINKTYQYAGYTVEQNEIYKKIMTMISVLPIKVQEATKVDLGFVYYSDLFKEEYNEVLASMEAGKSSYKGLLFLKIAVFKAAFQRQKLAFGPYLALGIFLVFLYGNQLLEWYMSLFIKIN